MPISVVNGYVCTSGCEAAKARKGIDPQAPPGTLPGEGKGRGNAEGPSLAGPAVVFGGTLRGLSSSARVNPAAPAEPGAAASHPRAAAIDVTI
jgi:hypothetical protein